MIIQVPLRSVTAIPPVDRRYGRTITANGRWPSVGEAIELVVSGRSVRVSNPDELRIDLDPQPGTGFDDARDVALRHVLAVLDDLGWVGFSKTSGNRGLHVYVRIEPRWTFTDVRHAAIAFAREVERRDPAAVT